MPALLHRLEDGVVIALKQIEELILSAPFHRVEEPGGLRLAGRLLRRSLGPRRHAERTDEKPDTNQPTPHPFLLGPAPLVSPGGQSSLNRLAAPTPDVGIGPCNSTPI